MKNQTPKSVVMVAGEASGDQHGAHVIYALRKRHADIQVCGAGGNAMKDAGAHLIVDARELSVMGFTAVFSKAPQILRSLSRLKRLLKDGKPDLLVLIDFPDFNLHLAGYAKKIGIPVLYYVSPQVWAWRSNRIKKIKKRVDHMAVILPFEKSIYDKHRIPVSFVGHPLMDAVPQESETEKMPTPTKGVTIALLPGSRECEVTRLLPEMLQAAQLLQQANPDLRFEISRAPSIDADLINNYAQQHALTKASIVSDPVYAIFKRCNLAIVASGTASLEAAIFGIPTVIVYSVSAFSFWLGNLLVNVPYIGLANLIANKRVLPELVQDKATAPNIAATAQNLLTDRDAYLKMQFELKSIRKKLGRAGASDRVAEIACRLMECECVI
jgi:lipid-A-disaccharide synthase